MNKAD